MLHAVEGSLIMVVTMCMYPLRCVHPDAAASFAAFLRSGFLSPHDVDIDVSVVCFV